MGTSHSQEYSIDARSHVLGAGEDREDWPIYKVMKMAMWLDIVQGAGEDDEDLEDEAFQQELEAMAQYGSEDEEPSSFAALHKRLAQQRREEGGAKNEGAQCAGCASACFLRIGDQCQLWDAARCGG